VAQNGAAPVDLGLRWFRQAIEGLRYAHHNGVVHRDLKPHNLLLTSEGNIKVGDFGLFKYVEPDNDATGARRPIRGTPHYMAPEQARGEHLDERSDMFSLGTTFFHVFTGRLPFDAPTPSEVLHKIAETDAPQLLAFAPELPRPLGVLLGRMLAREKEDRYQDVSVLLADLESYVMRGLLPVADSGSFAAADDGPPAAAPMIGLETSAYLPGVPSDPAMGSA
jgi:serine/threonine-protein kinase